MNKILILSANPRNTEWLRLDEEVREIKTSLKLSKYRDSFEVITEGAVRIDDLRRALLNYEPWIVHFSGHGTGDKNSLLENNSKLGEQQRDLLPKSEALGGIALENDTGQMQLVSTKSLADLFKGFKNKIECVLLNACYSEVQSEEIYKHIDCIIGMKCSIQDRAALDFSKGFYDAIGAGRNYKDAFEFGRNNIDINGISQSLIPVIKIRENSSILPSINPTIPKPKEQKSDMTEEKPSQSLNISGSLSNVQLGGQAGRDVNANQIQQISQEGTEKNITKADVVKLIAQLEREFRDSSLPETQVEKAIKHLELAKEEAQAEEPDKSFAAKNLQRATKVLKEAGETVEAGTGLWKKVVPIINRLLPWLGVAANFFS